MGCDVAKRLLKIFKESGLSKIGLRVEYLSENGQKENTIKQNFFSAAFPLDRNCGQNCVFNLDSRSFYELYRCRCLIHSSRHVSHTTP